MNHPQTSQTHTNVTETAALTGTREYTVRSAIADGTLTATVLPDGTLAVDVRDVRAWMDSLPKTGGFR